MTTIPTLLTAYGIPHTMGYLDAPDGTPNPAPLDPLAFLDTAKEMGFVGVEIPLLPWRGNAKSLPLEQLKEELEARGLIIVPDFMALVNADVETFRQFLRDAAFLGAKTVRTMISNVLCGDRQQLEGGWEPRMEIMAAHLLEVLPVAEDLGIAIAVENHQDATSSDLLRLFDLTGRSSAFGVCLDAGNPLAVCEGPMEYARRVSPLVRHIHLKDYTIHYAPEGYHLVRCPAGTGAVDFPAILEMVSTNGYPITPGVEIAAQQTRTIEFLKECWWDYYPLEQHRYLVEALRVVWKHARPADEPYGSAWERGASSEAVIAEEWDVLRQSAEYFQSLQMTPLSAGK